MTQKEASGQLPFLRRSALKGSRCLTKPSRPLTPPEWRLAFSPNPYGDFLDSLDFLASLD